MTMSPFERDTPEHTDPAGDGSREPATTSGSTSDAEDAASVIAKLVARSAGGRGRPGPSSVVSSNATVVQPALPSGSVTQRFEQPVPQRSEQPVTQRFEQPVPQRSEEPVTQRFEQPVPQRFEEPVTQRFEQPVQPGGPQPDPYKYRPVRRRPPLKILVAGVGVAVLLIAVVFALSRPASTQAKALPPVAQENVAPAVYAVKVSDVIADCASHAHGRAKSSFETQNCVKATRFLASGHVNGRPVLYVVSQIQMRSSDAAASIKEVLDSNGTGNLNDLLLEGNTFPGAPAKMPDSGYASVQTGALVVLAEAGFDDGGPSSNTNPALRAAAAQVAALVRAKS